MVVVCGGSGHIFRHGHRRLLILCLFLMVACSLGLPLAPDAEEGEKEGLLVPEDISYNMKESPNHVVRKKRLTMDFNGVRVSYPQYLRLVRLRDKVIRLGRMINALRSRYSEDALARLPQFHRLVALHTSLMPLLPPGYDVDLDNFEVVQEDPIERMEEDDDEEPAAMEPEYDNRQVRVSSQYIITKLGLMK